MHASFAASKARRICRSGGAVVLLVTAGGCVPSCDLHYGSEKRPIHEDRGPTLAVDAQWANSASRLAFTADGTEVVYPALDGALRAVRLADGAQRQVDAGPVAGAGALVPTSDGTALYYTTADYGDPPDYARPPVYSLREAYSGTDIAAGATKPLPIAVSPSGTLLLLAVDAGTEILDLEGGEPVATGCRSDGPAAFSPDGDEVVCESAGTPGQLARVSTSDGSATALTALGGTIWPIALRWLEDGIVVGFVPPPTPSTARDPVVLVGDPVTGEVQALAAGHDAQVGSEMALSPDGRILAIGVAECLAGGGMVPSCTVWEKRYVVFDLTTGGGAMIASGDGEGGGAIAVSPDGRTLVYQYGEELHVRPAGL